MQEYTIFVWEGLFMFTFVWDKNHVTIVVEAEFQKVNKDLHPENIFFLLKGILIVPKLNAVLLSK